MNFKFLLTVVISMFFSVFAGESPVASGSSEPVASQKDAGQSAQIVNVDQKLLSQIMARLAELHIKVEKIAIDSVKTNLENINEGIRKQFGPILETLVLLVLPNGEGVVVKKQELEDAMGYNLEKFIEDNRKAVEAKENPAKEQPEADKKAEVNEISADKVTA